MSSTVTRSGILVGVDGSAESDAAIRWATHEAVMRHAAMTLMHVVPPVAASWPIGPMYADIANGKVTTRGTSSSKRSRR